MDRIQPRHIATAPALHPHHQRFGPVRVLKSLVDASMFPFMSGLARFLPSRKLDEVTRSLGELEDEFREARSAFAYNEVGLQELVLKEWPCTSKPRHADRVGENPERYTVTTLLSPPLWFSTQFGHEQSMCQWPSITNLYS